jgi:outer membrane protein assembly factor BamB
MERSRANAEVVREYGPFEGVDNVRGVTFDGEHMWFAAGDHVQAVDPETGATVRRIDVPAAAGTAFDGTHLFQISRDMRIQKIDVSTGHVLSSIPAPSATSSGLTWAEGALWVGDYANKSLRQIDPETGDVKRTLSSTRFVTGVTFVDGDLWHGTWEDNASEIRRVDARTGEVLETIEMPPDHIVSGLEAGRGDVFFCGGGTSKKVRVVKRPARRPKAR